MTRKTDPNHKATFSFGVACTCSCGWRSGTWFGKGAKGSAAAEWHIHRDDCEKTALAEAAEIKSRIYHRLTEATQ